MSPEEIRESWSRFLDGGELSPESQRTLVDALEADPELRDSLLDNLQLDGILREMDAARRDGDAFVRTLADCIGAEHDATRFVRKVESRLHEDPPPATPPAGGRRNSPDTTRLPRRRTPASESGGTAWKPALIAAAAFIAILLLVAGPTGTSRPPGPKPAPQVAQIPTPPETRETPPTPTAKPEVPLPAPAIVPEPKPEEPPKPVVAEEPPKKIVLPTPAPKSEPAATSVAAAPDPTVVERVAGNVYLARSKSDKVRLKKDDVVPAGDDVDTYPSSSARLRFGDGTWIDVGPGSTFRELSAPTATAGRRVFLASGSLESQIAKQPPDRPMVFVTPTGEATILGTTIRLTVAHPGTTLEVKEGRVRLKNLLDGKSADVSAGQFAVAAAGAEIAAHRLFGDEVLVKFGPADVKLKAGWVLDSGEEFDPARGYGWKGPRDGGPVPGLFWRDPATGRQLQKNYGRFAARRTTDPNADPLKTTDVVAGWAGQAESWRMPVPNGRYLISVCCGDVSYEQGPHHVNVEGVQIIDQKINKAGQLIEVLNVPVEVKDGELTMIVGGNPGTRKSGDGSSDTCINYLLIRRVRK